VLPNAPYGCKKQHAASDRGRRATVHHARPGHRGLPTLDALAAGRREATADGPTAATRRLEARRRLGPGADRLDDMQQMRAHRPLGGLGIVRGDGVDDGGVLRQ
jgi:hypothetical protein